MESTSFCVRWDVASQKLKKQNRVYIVNNPDSCQFTNTVFKAGETQNFLQKFYKLSFDSQDTGNCP